ncbi:MAG: TM2 domain-containing protein, partial [Treponema sp.]|nr:TM2 domain-containing protein [Treponema sp.]
VKPQQAAGYQTQKAMPLMKDAPIFLLVFSTNSNDSKHVLKEIDAACKYEKIVIPFRIDDCQLDEAVEYYLSATHWLDAINQPIENQLHNLVSLVNKYLDKTAKEPAPPSGKEQKPHNDEKLVSAAYAPATPAADEKYCFSCGRAIKRTADVCPFCGARQETGATDGYPPGYKPKNKLSAILLCIFLGSYGVHRFYVGKIGSAIGMLGIFIISVISVILADVFVFSTVLGFSFFALFA